jgi:hypothetical protein
MDKAVIKKLEKLKETAKTESQKEVIQEKINALKGGKAILK